MIHLILYNNYYYIIKKKPNLGTDVVILSHSLLVDTKRFPFLYSLREQVVYILWRVLINWSNFFVLKSQLGQLYKGQLKMKIVIAIYCSLLFLSKWSWHDWLLKMKTLGQLMLTHYDHRLLVFTTRNKAYGTVWQKEFCQ